MQARPQNGGALEGGVSRVSASEATESTKAKR